MDSQALDRIVVNKDILVGKPTIRGTRISVELVLGMMADGWTEQEILEDFRSLVHEDIVACLAFARDIIAEDYEFTSAA